MLEADKLRATIKRDLSTALDTAQKAARDARNQIQSLLKTRTTAVDARSADLSRLSTQLDAFTARTSNTDPTNENKALNELQKEHDALRVIIDAQKVEVDTLRLIFNGGSDTDELKNDETRSSARQFVTHVPNCKVRPKPWKLPRQRSMTW